jgi:hypothetical protein
VLETLHMSLIIAWFYGISVTQFGNKESYTDVNWTFDTAVMFHGIIGTLVQVRCLPLLRDVCSYM